MYLWVYAIHRDPSGVLWVGTNGGLSRGVYPSKGSGDPPECKEGLEDRPEALRKISAIEFGEKVEN